MQGDQAADVGALVAQVAEAMRATPREGGFLGRTPRVFGPQVFGGFLVGQALYAAALTVAPERRIHSLHAYFARPAQTGPDLLHRVAELRDGRAFSLRDVDSRQDGRSVFQMSCSFTVPTEAAEAELDGGVADPETAGVEAVRAWEVSRLGPAGQATSRAWFRLAARLPDEPAVHDALVAMMTDMTAMGGDPVPGYPGREMVSLDHAVWFHRHLRADEWIYFELRPLARSGDRALIQGAMYGPDRLAALTMAQEVILRPPTS